MFFIGHELNLNIEVRHVQNSDNFCLRNGHLPVANAVEWKVVENIHVCIANPLNLSIFANEKLSRATSAFHSIQSHQLICTVHSDSIIINQYQKPKIKVLGDCAVQYSTILWLIDLQEKKCRKKIQIKRVFDEENIFFSQKSTRLQASIAPGCRLTELYCFPVLFCVTVWDVFFFLFLSL